MKELFVPIVVICFSILLNAKPGAYDLKTKQQKYLDLDLKYADTQWILPEGARPEEKSWAEQGYSWQTRIRIDDMFMITAVKAQAYRTTGDRKYIDRAAKTYSRRPARTGSGIVVCYSIVEVIYSLLIKFKFS